MTTELDNARAAKAEKYVDLIAQVMANTLALATDRIAEIEKEVAS